MQIRQEEKLLNSNRHYSLRKLSVGLASVLIGISFLNGTKTTVKADTIANNNDEYAKAHENNESSESIQDALLKNTDVAEGDSVHTQSDKNVDTAGILPSTSPVQSSSAAQNNSEISTKTGEVSKAGNFEVAGDISSAQNSVAKSQQNNLQDDLNKQKTFTENNQAETKNQENGLADQTNYKLTNNGGTDSKEDLGQNLTTPDETKSTLTTKSDADKSIAGSSSAQHVNNQSNNRADGNSQAQPQNSLKLAKRMLATNLIETNSSIATNGGFDEATWGKLDVNNWQGQVENGVYQLTSYTGDSRHIIVPNEADFEQAGKSTNGLQVGIDRDTARSLLLDQTQTIAFSKTNNQKVKAIGTDWSHAFSAFSDNFTRLHNFDGSNLDVSSVTNMNHMFWSNLISDLTSLAHWDTSKVTDMSQMFDGNSISDLTQLSHWDTSNVTDMSGMFNGNQISDLTPLAHWDTSKVTNMSDMFDHNLISDLTPLAHWDTSNVTDMSLMFDRNQISDLTPLTNWKTNSVTNMSGMFNSNSINNLTPLANWNTSNVTNIGGMFYHNSISDLTPLTHWDTRKVTNMGAMFKDNKISDLTPLTYWNTSSVTNMSSMFNDNKISDLTPLTHWDTSKVTDMSAMFTKNPDIIDLKPIANWNISIDESGFGFFEGGLFVGDSKLDLMNINNTSLMQGFLKTPHALQGSTFITNNVDLAKAVVGKEAQALHSFTNTATRTITFHIPHAAPETTVQHIYYKTIAPVQIDYPIRSIGGGGSSSGTGSIGIIGGHGSSSGGFHYTLGGGGFSSGAGSSVVVGGYGSSSGSGSSSGTGSFSGSGSSSGTGGNVIIREKMRMAFANAGAPVQTGSNGPKIVKTYPLTDVKESDWQLDDSKPNDDVIIDGVICFKPVQIPHINGYKAKLIQDKANPAMFLVSFVALPKRLQNNQSHNVQLPQKPAKPEQKQPEPIQTKPADDKQVNQAIDQMSDALMHDFSSNANSFEPVQGDSALLEASSDTTQNGDAAKTQRVNTAKHKKHIVKKRAIKRRRKHAKKYHLKRRLRKYTKHSRKHTKRVKHTKKRMIKHRKRVSRKFRKYNLKHIKKN